MKSGIYKITNTINGKVYIGSSSYVKRRISAHKNELLRKVHKNFHVQAAVDKYGIENFLFELVEHCHLGKLIEREQFYIDSFDRDMLYNIVFVAGECTGYRHSEETLARMSTPRPRNKPPVIKKKHVPWNKGTKGLIIAWNKGTTGLMAVPWNKGLKGIGKPLNKGAEYKFISPTGEIYEGECLAKFAREQGLNKRCIYRVFYGKRPQHKGWRLAA